jgi:hypothetical protein
LQWLRTEIGWPITSFSQAKLVALAVLHFLTFSQFGGKIVFGSNYRSRSRVAWLRGGTAPSWRDHSSRSNAWDTKSIAI